MNGNFQILPKNSPKAPNFSINGTTKLIANASAPRLTSLLQKDINPSLKDLKLPSIWKLNSSPITIKEKTKKKQKFKPLTDRQKMKMIHRHRFSVDLKLSQIHGSRDEQSQGTAQKMPVKDNLALLKARTKRFLNNHKQSLGKIYSNFGSFPKIEQNKELCRIWNFWETSKRMIQTQLRMYYFLHHAGMMQEDSNPDNIYFLQFKENEFENFITAYDKSSQRIFLSSIQKYYKMLTLGKPNSVLQTDTEEFKRLVYSIDASKHEDSDTTDFDGFLKIKYYFIDRQATDEELEKIKDYAHDLFDKFKPDISIEYRDDTVLQQLGA
ncbi:unnamed protein product [Moneuplotes crassus]|uniref:Uncharacterized protein n=1 Tax=Euplotes crassus TaxID=5936 RepID=A0AAD1XIC0_EUPCR|nr:unnamed protein product [Moneuplotes crassus]